MTHMRMKLIAGGLVMVAAVSYLAIAGARSGWVYFVDVDQFTTDPQYQNQRVRLHGKVLQDDFSAASAALTARFMLGGKNARLSVVYRGSIPDMFEPGREVVVEGKRDPAGVFQADVLMTKCASKYEPGSPHQNTTNGGEQAVAVRP